MKTCSRCRADQRPPRPNGSEGVQHVEAARQLGEVTSGSRQQRRHQCVVVIRGGEHERTYARLHSADLPRHLDPAPVLQAHVEDHHVRLQVENRLHRHDCRCRVADNRDVPLGRKQVDQAAPDEVVIIEQVDAEAATYETLHVTVLRADARTDKPNCMTGPVTPSLGERGRPSPGQLEGSAAQAPLGSGSSQRNGGLSAAPW